MQQLSHSELAVPGFEPVTEESFQQMLSMPPFDVMDLPVTDFSHLNTMAAVASESLASSFEPMPIATNAEGFPLSDVRAWSNADFLWPRCSQNMLPMYQQRPISASIISDSLSSCVSPVSTAASYDEHLFAYDNATISFQQAQLHSQMHAFAPFPTKPDFSFQPRSYPMLQAPVPSPSPHPPALPASQSPSQNLLHLRHHQTRQPRLRPRTQQKAHAPCPRMQPRLEPKLSPSVLRTVPANNGNSKRQTWTRVLGKDLVRMRLEGLRYKDIINRTGTYESESTLRGRFRALTKPANERMRRPEWTDFDVQLLCQAVETFLPARSYPADPEKIKIPWKKVSEYIKEHGGSQAFAFATCRRKWLAEVEKYMAVHYQHK